MGRSSVRSWAFGLLTVALLLEIGWIAMHVSRPIGALVRPLLFTGGFVVVALTRGRYDWVGLLGRLVVAGAFLSALWGRFGNWPGFVRYAGVVNSFLPSEVIPAVAVVATVTECALCAAMLLGIMTRWAAAGSAVLLFLFATAMTASGLSQAEWAVYVLSAGAFALATIDASFVSVDRLLASTRQPLARDRSAA
jgi:uncharacterized membrane protein YphA (DoxX/SURF4 family)